MIALRDYTLTTYSSVESHKKILWFTIARHAHQGVGHHSEMTQTFMPFRHFLTSSCERANYVAL